MTYSDPLRLYLKGDKQKAGRYVREARRLAFLLLRQGADSGVQIARRTWRAQDGTTVEVLVAGMQVTAIITSPSKKKAERDFEDFVVWARINVLPDGIDPEYPQQILRPSWTTFFYSNLTPGFEDFPGKKGTYKLNPDGTDLFPDGIVHAGEVDWRGTDKERLSWYGPSTRYWFDAWRQPSAQYGRFVFHLGQVLLDVDQYCTDSDDNWAERLVLGAAVRQHEDGRWLYVFTANIPDQVTPPVALPDGPSAYISQNYPLGNITNTLRRLRLTEDPDETVAQRWSVVNETAEVLWTASINRGCNPWIFHPEGTKATTFFQDTNPLLVFSDTMSEELTSPPPSVSGRVDVMIDEAGVATYALTTPSVPAGVGEADVAVDYTEEGAEILVRIGRKPIEASPHGLYLRMGEYEAPLYWKQMPPAGYSDSAVQCAIVACDARESMVLLDRRNWSWIDDVSPSSVFREVSLEVHCRGSVDRIMLNSTTGTASGLARLDRDIGALEAVAEYQTASLLWIWCVTAQLSEFSVRTNPVAAITAAAAKLPFHEDDVFGQSGTRGLAEGPKNTDPMSDYAGDYFCNNRLDVHSHRSAIGAAAVNGVVLASLYNPLFVYTDLGTDANTSFHYATGGELPALTGVTGQYERYHPIWVLGQPIGGED